MSSYHEPVMLNEALSALDVKPGGTYVDATFGGGGHAGAILNKLENGRLIAFDQDKDAMANAINDKRFLLISQNFRHLKRFLQFHKAIPVDGILADLGVSSHQIDTPNRGFSTRYDAPLDMRMHAENPLSAADIVNEYDAGRLQQIFSMYGNITNSKTLANTIVSARNSKPILTTGQLVALISSCIRGQRSKYLAKVFQAIRIEVNKEVEALKDFLTQSAQVIRQGGVLVVIAYHSLEDRLVKNFMKRGNFSGELAKDFYGNQLLPFRSKFSKPLLASEEEVKTNPRARSAKMRIGIKT